MNKIGIFSGTFDPVHNGHLQFADEAMEKFGLGKVYFLIEPRPRNKQGVKAFEHRLAMVQIAIGNNPKFGTIILKQSRFSPEKTVPILLTRFDKSQIYLLIGDDVLNNLIHWPSVNKLFKSVEFLIGVRGDDTKTKNQVQAIKNAKGDMFRYQLFKAKHSKISSSLVRAEIKNKKHSNHIPKEVFNYITSHKLYASWIIDRNEIANIEYVFLCNA